MSLPFPAALRREGPCLISLPGMGTGWQLAVSKGCTHTWIIGSKSPWRHKPHCSLNIYMCDRVHTLLLECHQWNEAICKVSSRNPPELPVTRTIISIFVFSLGHTHQCSETIPVQCSRIDPGSVWGQYALPGLKPGFPHAKQTCPLPFILTLPL